MAFSVTSLFIRFNLKVLSPGSLETVFQNSVSPLSDISELYNPKRTF